MSALPEIRALFRAPAGSRRGFGHLVRCRSLARALGVRPLVCVRGTNQARDIALRLGCDVVNGPVRRLLSALEPDLLVVDDPIESHASRWIAAARAARVPVVTIHDLGLGCLDGDLAIDGSVTASSVRGRQRTAVAPFAILDPEISACRVRTRVREGVLIALGGGPRVKIARAIALEVARRAPHTNVRVAAGFISTGPATAGDPRNVTWLAPSTKLAAELSRAAVAVVGGGVSLYEACAAGTAAVGVPVVGSQRPTVAGFVARGAALGRHRSSARPQQIADDVLRLLRDHRLRRRMVQAARRLVDGRGAWRAAREIELLLVRHTRREGLRYAS